MFNSIPKGIKFAVITALISGISIFINKYAVNIINPPMLFAAVKNAGVGLILLPFITATGKLDKIKNIKKTDLIYLILIAIIGGSIPFFLFFTGLSIIPAINGAIIHKTMVLWIVLLAIPFLNEKVNKIQLIAIILLFAGNLFIGGFKGFLFSRGEFLVLVATMLWAIESIMAKKILSRIDPDIVSGARMILGSIILLASAIIIAPKELTEAALITPAQFSLLLLTMILLFAYVTFWYRALKYSSVITVSAILVSSTLVTNILSAIFVTRTLTIPLIIQSILILVGITILINTKKSGNKQALNIKARLS